MMGNFREDSSASASSITILSTSNSASTTSLFEEARSISPRSRRSVPKEVENAVYGFIKAVRALGRTNITTGEISRALEIPLKQVDAAALNLKNKGVKVA